jgi:hypothetical protein
VGYHDIRTLAEFNNELYVSGIATHGSWGLFKITAPGEYDFILDLGGPIDLMVEHNGRLVFFPYADEWARYHEVWTTDGTLEGTLYLTTMWLDFDKFWQMPVDHAVIGDALFFGSEYSRFLFKTDGYCVDVVQTGVSTAYGMEPLKNSLVFGAETPYYGNEPYIYRNIPKGSPCPAEALTARTATDERKESTILTPHPNPFTTDFTMRLEGSEDELADVAVYTASGMPVEQFTKMKANTDYSAIGANWPKGMYIVKVNRSGVITTHMVVKK